MNIVITGGTGLVGTHLVNDLKDEYTIYILTRSNRENKENIIYINWTEDGWEKEMPKSVYAVINLAGASLQKRWTTSHKKAIISSRVETTKALYQYFKNHQAPEVLFNASAIGYYTPSETKTYDERDISTPNDLLSEVASLWESYAHYFEQLGTRVIIGRFGIIFSNKGGALPLIVKPYQFFIGGPIGNGQQWFSWVHINDVVKAIKTLIESNHYIGIFNITSPNPVTQDSLGKIIGQVFNRPHWLIVPKFLLKVVLGEQSNMILNTQKVLPYRLESKGYKFKFPTAKEALEDLY